MYCLVSMSSQSSTPDPRCSTGPPPPRVSFMKNISLRRLAHIKRDALLVPIEAKNIGLSARGSLRGLGALRLAPRFF